MSFSAESIVRGIALILLFGIFIPCQAFVAANFYHTFEATDLRPVTMAVAAGLSIVESLMASIAVASWRLKLWGRTVAAAGVLALALLPFAFVIEVASVSTHFKADETSRTSAIARYAAADRDTKALEASIRELRAALPETLRAKPAAALEAELRGVNVRIARYAEAPPSLLSRQSALESAIATRAAIDDATNALGKARQTLLTPTPATEHPAILLIDRLLKMFGRDVPSDIIRLGFSIGLVVALKLTTVALAWNVVDRRANPAAGGNIAAAAPAAPANNNAAVGATPGGAVNPPAANAAQGGAPSIAGAKGIAKARPGIAAALRKAFGGKNASP